MTRLALSHYSVVANAEAFGFLGLLCNRLVRLHVSCCSAQVSPASLRNSAGSAATPFGQMPRANSNDVVVANDQRATAGSGQRRDVRRGEARTYDKTSGRQLAERIKSRGRAARAKKR